MYFELDVPVPEPALPLPAAYNPKGKGKQAQNTEPLPSPLLFNAPQIAALETRIELLAQLGYTVLCLTQTERGPIDPKSFVNVLTALIPKLRKPDGIVLASRLTIALDGKCDSGFGLTQANASLFSGFDVIALRPTTVATFNAACLTHSVPSPLTAHVICVPLSPKVPFQMKHTLVKTARKAGVVFEISCAGAIRGEEGWWGSAREVVRVAKGKNVVLTGGGEPRGPRDLSNLGRLLDLQPDAAQAAVSGACRSMLIRARGRRIYRSTISEPRLIIPGVAPTVDPLNEALEVLAVPVSIHGEDESGDETDASGTKLKRKYTGTSNGGARKKRKKKLFE